MRKIGSKIASIFSLLILISVFSLPLLAINEVSAQETEEVAITSATPTDTTFAISGTLDMSVETKKLIIVWFRAKDEDANGNELGLNGMNMIGFGAGADLGGASTIITPQSNGNFSYTISGLAPGIAYKYLALEGKAGSYHYKPFYFSDNNFNYGETNLLTYTSVKSFTTAGSSTITTGKTFNLTFTVTGSFTKDSQIQGIIFPAQPTSSFSCLDGQGDGEICVKPNLKENSVFKLTAKPSADAVFAGWSGGLCSGTNPVCDITLTSSLASEQNIIATFNKSSGTGTDTPPGGVGTDSSSTPTTPTAPSVKFGGLENPLGGIDSLAGFVEKVLNIVIMIGIPIVALAIIYSGFLFVKARGNAEELKTAKQTLLYTIIGAAILLGSWVLAQAICVTISQLGTSSSQCK